MRKTLYAFDDQVTITAYYVLNLILGPGTVLYIVEKNKRGLWTVDPVRKLNY